MNVVCIGGGKGLASALQAWKALDVNLTAIVATTDNGGCSGRLRTAGSPVPWGDIRKALLALANKDDMLASTLSHRLTGLAQLTGHCMGNLMLESLYQQTESVSDAIKLMAKQIGVTGTVLPMSNSSVDLMAIMHNGETVGGEVNIDAHSALPATLMLDRQIKALPECIEAINNADIVCVGPGRILTSVMPALLLNDIEDALHKSNGIKIFIHNIEGEKTAAGKMGKTQVEQWLFAQCKPNTFNGVLSRTTITLEQNRYTLPVKLRNGRGALSFKHDIDSLTAAFHFLLCKVETRLQTQYSAGDYVQTWLIRFKQRHCFV